MGPERKTNPNRTRHNAHASRRVAAYLTVDEAAEALRLSEDALWARLRRGEIDAAGRVALGGGWYGLRFGKRSWRIQPPSQG